MARAIRNNVLFRLPLYFSNVVTVYIGGNDLDHARSSYKAGTCGGLNNQQCLGEAVYAFKLNWDAIMAEVLHLRSGRPTLIRVATIYNPYVNIDKASNDFLVLEPYLDDVNDYIVSTAGNHQIPVADVHKAFNGPSGAIDPSDQGLLAFDNFHPNAAGHALIANLLGALGYQPIVP